MPKHSNTRPTCGSRDDEALRPCIRIKSCSVPVQHTTDFSDSEYSPIHVNDQTSASGLGCWEGGEGKQALKRCQALINTISDGIYKLDTDGRFVAVDDGFIEMTGYSQDDLAGEDISVLLDESDVGRVEDLIHDCSATGSSDASYEVTIKTADGDRIPCELHLNHLVDGDEFEGTIGAVQNISERKENQRQLEEAEEHYRTLIENFPNGAVALVNEDIQYRTVGGSPFDVADVTVEELEGQPVAEVLPSELANELVPRYEAAFDGESSTFQAESNGSVYEFQIVPVRDDDGDVFAALGLSQDITEHIETKRKLTESEQRYRTLVENFPNGSVALFDEGYRYTAVGGELFDQLDFDPEDRIGKRFTDIHPPEIVEQVEPHFEEALDGVASSFEIEYEHRHLHGTTLPVGDAQDEISAGMLVIQDVTERREHERQLERNKEQLETLFDVLPVGVVVAEADGEIVEANDLAHEIWGGDVFDAQSIEEYEQYSVRWVDSGEPVPPEEMTLARVVNGETVLDPDVFQIDAVDGKRRIIELKGMPIRDGSGDVTRGVVTMSDVTERNETQRQLEESEQLYRTLAEHFPNGTVGVYDHDLRYTLAAGEKVGDPAPSAEEIEGTRMPDLYPDDAVADLEPLFRTAIEDGETGSIRTEVVGRTWKVWAMPLEGADGEIFAGLSFAQDITEQLERERELERALDLLNKTERIADVAGWEVDPETEGPYWSDHLFNLLDVDYDEQPTLDQALDVYYSDEDRAIVEDAVEEALETGDSFDVTARFPRPAGDIGTLRVQGEPKIDDAEVVSLRGAVQDITEQVEREQQLEELVEQLEESNERLEQFAYAASHDLQEPLRMVSSYLQLLERRYTDDLDEEAEEFIDFAVDGAERMREMIEALLAYSRVETRGDPFEPVDLDTVLADVLADLQLPIDETNAEIISDDLPMVAGDASQLRQVFQNLLENALEYSGEEPPQVHVAAERKGDEWLLAVEDNGIGIDPADADRVFEVFQRLHSRDEHEGTGIGLALCERIVERHGGDIWVESEPGKGATFSFTLPATES